MLGTLGIYHVSMRPRHACLGKRGVMDPKPWWKSSFNEAEARVPRKTDPKIYTGDGVRIASMRPRHACLGKQQRPLLHIPSRYKLQ